VLPVYTGYKTWCDQCGWNLEAPSPTERQSLFEKLYASFGRKMSARLFEEIVNREPLKIGLTPAKVLAFLIAGCVHGVTLAFLVLGFWLFLAFPSSRFLGVMLGVACLTMTWFLLIPRFAQPTGTLLPKERFPALYHIVNRVAEAVNSPPIDLIHYDMRFNAGFGQFGWKRRQTLILGLPLAMSLSQEEFVALLGHELAHGVSGDPNRNLFLGSAVRSLSSWYTIISPGRRWQFRMGIVAPLMLVINLVSLPIAGLIWLTSYGLINLLWHDMQRAEYLADFLGALVAGTDGCLSLLDKIQLGETFEVTLIFSYLDRKTESLFANLRHRIGQVPEREIERLRRIEQLSEYRANSTHPPTNLRVDFLKAHYIAHPKVALSSNEFEQFEREMEPLLTSVQKWLSNLDDITFRERFKVRW